MRHARIIIAHYPDAFGSIGSFECWSFLGKNINKRRRLTNFFSVKTNDPLDNQLHEINDQLRDPFLDFISRLGECQKDQVTWWSTACSWKSWSASDLFLLVGYLQLASQFIDEAQETSTRRLLVIEDPWLFAQLKQNHRDDDSVAFVGKETLFVQKTVLLVFGLIKRLKWLMTTLYTKARQRLVWPESSLPLPEKPAAGIYSYPSDRCFKDHKKWNDPFLPGIDRLLEEGGYHAYRFTPPEANGYEGVLAEQYRSVYPLIFYTSLRIILKVLVTHWKVQWPTQMAINETAVNLLLEREWWQELGRPNLCVYRLFYESLSLMLATGAWSLLVFPYENQPWEKMLVLAARLHDVRSIGIQHAIFSRFSLAYYWGRGDIKESPRADFICTSGSYLTNLLIEGNHPVAGLRELGSLRYNNLAQEQSKPSAQRIDQKIAQCRVLVILPIDRYMTYHLLEAIRQAFPHDSDHGKMEFLIKAHPMCPVTKLPFKGSVVTGDLTELLQSCDIVLFIGSTVGAEAMAQGKKVVRYCPNYLVNVDPSEVYGSLIASCSEVNLRDVLIRVAQQPLKLELSSEVAAMTKQIFAPFDKKGFKKMIQEEIL